VGTITNSDPSSNIASQPDRRAHALIVADDDQTPSAPVRSVSGAA
jgi:hypothetical protein